MAYIGFAVVRKAVATNMRKFLTGIIGLVATPALALAPAFADYCGDARCEVSNTVGIWQGLFESGDTCTVSGTSGPYTLSLQAAIQEPTKFYLFISGPFGESPKSVSWETDNGLGQTLTEVTKFVPDNDFIATLTGAPQNNFASFLHGFTAGSTMSFFINNQLVKFDLTGTSAMMSSLGQCTDKIGFNQLPPPWRPASAAPSAPVQYNPPSPAPAPAEDSTDDSYPQTINSWWFYNYAFHSCQPAEFTPKQAYDSLNDTEQGPVVDRMDKNHIRIEWPDSTNPQLTNYYDYFRNKNACESFSEDLASQNSDLN